jgi:hypothetical protein
MRWPFAVAVSLHLRERVVQREGLHVALAASPKTVPELLTTAFSVLEHASEKVHFHVLASSDPAPGSVEATVSTGPVVAALANAGMKLRRSAKRNGDFTYRVYAVHEERPPDLPWAPDLGFLRLYLPFLLRDVDRVVYLDTDRFVLADLAEIASAPVVSCGLAAVPADPTFGSLPASFDAAALQHSWGAGVLVLSLQALRNPQYKDALRSHLAALREVPGGQEALLSLYCPDPVALGKEWDAGSSTAVTQESVRIWHLPVKPPASESCETGAGVVRWAACQYAEAAASVA